MSPTVVSGDLLDQEVEVIVNAWNQNFIPWWLLLPQGISGAIKKKGGLKPFRELRKAGYMRLGSSYVTGAGRMNYQNIIHVAGINAIWCATEFSIRESVRTSMACFETLSANSIGYPVIGSGSGSFSPDCALEIMLDEFAALTSKASVVVVKYL